MPEEHILKVPYPMLQTEKATHGNAGPESDLTGASATA